MFGRLQRFLRSRRGRRVHAWSVLGQFAILNLAMFGFVVFADDCARDWRRAEDCLRTPGFAQTIGSAGGVIATILVNGVAIQTILLSPPETDEEGNQIPGRQYFFDIRTQGGRTSLQANGQDSLWIYASVSCSDPEVDTSGVPISFHPGGTNWDWLKIAPGAAGGMQAAQVFATAPAGSAGPGSAAVVVTAAVEGQSLRADVPLALVTESVVWEVATEPADPPPLVPNSSQLLLLKARIRFDAAAYPPELAQQLLQETQDNMRFTGGEWLDLSEPAPLGEGFMAVNIAASDPSGEPMRSARPESCPVTITTSFQGQPMQTTYPVKLAPRPELDVEPEIITLQGGAGESFEVKAWIDHPGPNSWTFTTAFKDNDEPICQHSVVKQGPAAAMVTIADAGQKDAAGVRYSWVTVTATDDVTGVEIIRGIRVCVAANGLQIIKGLHSDGTVHVLADGKQVEKTVTFQLVAYDPETKQLINGERHLKDLHFEFNHEPKTPEANVVAYCGLTRRCDLVYSATPTSADWVFKAEKELPGEDRIVVHYTVSAPGLEGEEFSRDLLITLEVMTLEQETEAKEIEYQRCREVVRKYIPAQFQEKFYNLIEQKKNKLGPKGLAALRRKIWSIAVNFILAEGDEAYKEMAEWADRIVTVLEYAQFAGDIAFNAAAGAFLGPYAAMGASYMKGVLISAVQAYEEGQNIEAWATQNLWSLVSIAEGQIIDVDTFEKLLGGNRYKAWAYYVAATFVLNLYRQEQVDFFAAAQETAKDIGLEKFNGWLGEKAKASLNKHGIKMTGPGGSETTIVKPGGDPGVKQPGDGPPGPKVKTGEAPGKSPGGPTKPADGPPKATDPAVKPADGPPKPTDPAVKPADGPPKPTDPAVKPSDGPPKPTDPAVKPADGPIKPPEGPTVKIQPGNEPIKQPDGPTKPADGPDKKPDEPGKQPDGPDKKPDGPEKKPDGPDKKPAGPEKQPDGPDKKPDGPEKKPDGPEKKPAGPEKKPDVPEKKPDGPEKKPDGPEKKPAGPEKKPDVPEKKPTKEERDAAWQKGIEQGKQKVRDLGEAMKSGDPEKVKQVSLEFLKDKNAMMQLNRDPGAGYQRQKVNQALKEVYKNVDQQVIAELKQKYGDDVRIFNATNPKKSTASESTSYDRDITAQRKAKPGEYVRDPNAPGGFHKVQPGETRWVDVPAKELEGTYSKHFYGEANNIPPGQRGNIDPKQAIEFAKQHDQTCTDRLSADSYGSSNKDLQTALTKPGDKFTDPGQIAGVMEYKANEWFEKADHIQRTDPVAAEGYRAEGMRQTTKQWNNQAVRRVEALRAQGVDVKIDPKLDKAMKELGKVTKGEISPAEAEARIRQMGYESPSQVANEMGSFVEMLDKLRPS